MTAGEGVSRRLTMSRLIYMILVIQSKPSTLVYKTFLLNKQVFSKQVTVMGIFYGTSGGWVGFYLQDHRAHTNI